MSTLIVAEHDNKTLKDSTNKAVTAAKAMGGEVDVLIAGKECKAAADAAAKLDDVKKVLVADAAVYEHQLAEPLAALIVSLAPKYDAIVAPATTTGKNVMPRVAALLDVMQISDITKVVSPDTFERPIYAGNAIQTVKSSDVKKVITVRTSTFQAAGTGGSASLENVAAAADPNLSSFRRRRIVEIRPARADLGKNHHLRRSRNAKPGELHQVHRTGGRQAWRRRRRLSRRGRRRLRAK
jgi:Electron transfer flavoprotein, alpha subunit